MCPSVRPAQTCLKVSIFILGQSGSVSSQSQVSLRSVSGQSQVSLRSLCAYFIRQTEPKILCLVKILVNAIKTPNNGRNIARVILICLDLSPY